MLTTQDTDRLKETFVTKEDYESDLADLIAHMATKKDLIDLEERIDGKFVTYLAPIVSRLDSHDVMFQNLDRKFDHVMNVLDKLAVSFSLFRDEYAVSVVQYQRQVEWNHKVAEKVGIPFDY